MKFTKKLLFNPGPTNVSDRVRNAIRTEDICHREPEFFEVLSRLNRNIVTLFNGESTHSAVLFVSSGTGCNEAIINSIEGKILVVNNGKYSDRIIDIIENYGISYQALKFDPLQPINMQQIENVLIDDHEITHIFAVHHETTTGILAPIHEIGRLAGNYNKIFCVDAVSSLGGHPFDLKKDNISFCSVSANKCLESFPGISLVIAKTEEIQKIKGKARSYYFDLYRQWEKEQKGETPFTPAVQLIYALDAAVNEFKNEGYENRIHRYQFLAKQMRKGLAELGFELILAPEDLQSNILTSIKLPADIDYWELHDKLKERGFTIYSDESVLSKGKFRIATMGSITAEDIGLFIENLKQVLHEIRR